MGARYDRALTCETRVRALKRGGKFGFLLHDLPAYGDDPYAFDVQLREKNKIMYYHGTTRLLVLQLSETSSDVFLTASASPRYGEYEESASAYEKMMRPWSESEASELRSAFSEYLLQSAQASLPRYYGKDDQDKRKHEGYWQNRLCVRFGPDCQPDDDWVVIDRECVLGFDDKKEKDEFYSTIRRRNEVIRESLQSADPALWGMSNEEKAKRGGRRVHFGDELDILALSQEGELLAIELKHGGNAKGIYWGPLQAALYSTAFRGRLPEVSAGIRDLIKQKVELGLLPSHALDRLPPADLTHVAPVLAVAEVKPKSRCWANMKAVMGRMDQRMEETVHVIEISADSGGETAVGVCDRHTLAWG